jgi:hypothetical protein
MDEAVQITAIVETVDQTAREVLLRGPEGRLLTIQVGPQSATWPSCAPAIA